MKPPADDETVPDVSRRLLWVTNLAAPYRAPVWSSLAERDSLTVKLLESNAQLAADVSSNRGSDWRSSTYENYKVEALSTWKISRGEARYYILRRLRDVFQVRKFDIIIFGGWESPAYWQLLVAALMLRRFRVGFYESPATTHTYHRGPIAWLRTQFYRSMHRIVVPGPAAKVAVLRMGIKPEVVAQGFNAVDVSRFSTGNGQSYVNQENDIGSHRFLFVGQLIARKRIAQVVEAYADIAGSADRLSIAGVGPLEAELKGLAQNLQVRAYFHGYVDGSHMPALMARSHTLVLTSEQEVWGLVVNEALASGMHVVVSENCGVVPSVYSMRGVYVVREDLSDLPEQMQKSKDAWRGRIPEPEILQFTPAKFAEVFRGVFDFPQSHTEGSARQIESHRMRKSERAHGSE